MQRCALGSASQQNYKLATKLREIHAPSGPHRDAKLGDTVAHRLNVAKQTAFKPLLRQTTTPRIEASVKCLSYEVNSGSALTLNSASM